MRAGSLMLLAGSLGALVPGCSIIIGEEPEPPRDGAAADAQPDANGNRDADNDEAAAEAGPSDTDAGADASSASDASAPHEAQVEVDAGAQPDASSSDGGVLDATLDATVDATLDAKVDATAPLDAGSGDADFDAAPDCSAGPVTWYPDGDRDGYGRSGEATSACPKPAGDWSRQGGDCRDNNDAVHPNQKEYFGSAYSLGNGKDSFDYDCSGQEDGDPGQATKAKGCVGLLGLACAGTGYTERDDRSGAGLNSLCGSNAIVVCGPGVLACEATPAPTPSRPYSCR